MIQLGSINLPAEDSGLTSRLDQFNAATAEHWEKMQSGTVDLEESELMEVSIDDLHDLAAGQFAAGLSLRQQTVKLTDLRAELLKDLSPELDRSVIEAEREESDTIKPSIPEAQAMPARPLVAPQTRAVNEEACI